MKKYLPLILLYLLGTALPSAYAQQLSATKIKGDFKNKALDLVLLELEINYRLQFEYEEPIIQDIKINQSFKKSKSGFATP